jgi:nicotinamide phosphoribosyltransferase
VLFLGTQHYLVKYMRQTVTAEQIDEAESFAAGHGVPFNREGWELFLSRHGGERWPVRIRAVPEGTIIPVKNLLLDIVNTDPDFYWMTSYLETSLLRAIWYPTTVASRDLQIYRDLRFAMQKTCDDGEMASIVFKHNDFGSRGVSSYESSEIGGLGHLVMFQGTDNMASVLMARHFYGEDMAGFSIPAAEHSTMTSWGGASGEIDAMRNMVQTFGYGSLKQPLIAVVSDSYDVMRATEEYWGGQLLDLARQSGSTIVVRPDSGDPIQTPISVIKALMRKVGFTTNSKGFRVLPPYYRVIQGDGMNETTIRSLLGMLELNKLSVSNIAIGMGGAMLQQLDRDTMKFAMKCSAIRVNGEWREVYKDPVTDRGKRSKRGRLDLLYDGKRFETVRADDPRAAGWRDYQPMQTVYEDGEITSIVTLKEIRERALSMA